ncbi:MAG: hypothetical protein PHZ07_00195 [Patescibacteria group bacterium]|nr:hypothetical protein [Patescibacteria group bacterium]MDD4304149.1 hypothetical protein [Patescibacteria group bacterium]MDD4695180.1 hypothetical protein [Patescibacteria group bacterium]
MTKKILIILFTLVILLTVVILFKNNNNTKNVENPQNNEDVKQEQLSIEEKLKNYLKDNISNLSSEKAVLGGTFYITDLQIEENNKAIVSYEDGHIALKANFDYIINNETIEISNFEIIKDNSVITENHSQCNNHEDCVPLPGCHSRSCINKKFIDQYQKPEMCTTLFDFCAAYTSEDCICQQGTCFNEKLMSAECNK